MSVRPATSDDYFRLLMQLLPRGPLWHFLLDGAIDGLLMACGDGLARVHARVDALRVEADPRTTTELLPEWEAAVSLPDGCIPTGGTLAERRAAVVGRLVATGGASLAYFKDLASRFGFDVTVENVGGFVWRVRMDRVVDETDFEAGDGEAGDRLGDFSYPPLECLIDRNAPAHTRVLYAYKSAS